MTLVQETVGCFSSPFFCEGGHVFVFAGKPEEGKVPEGYPCSCGMFRAHYEICPECGQERLTLERIEKP